MRICVLGNSHVACLKQAWDEIADTHAGNIEMRFFASRGLKLRALEFRSGDLVPTIPELADHIRHTSGGFDRIHLAAFDAFLVHGLGLNIWRTPRTLSRAVLRQCCEDAVAISPGVDIARQIHNQTGRRVFVAHAPMLAVSGPDAAAIPYLALYEDMRRVLEPDGIDLLRQPDQTLHDGSGTRLEFTLGAMRLDIGVPDPQGLEQGKRNVAHMNAAFGRIMLDQFLPLVAQSAAR